jgi:hypothetical protein
MKTIVPPVFVALFSLGAAMSLSAQSIEWPASVTNSPGEFSETVRVFEVDHDAISSFYDFPWSDQRMDRLEKFVQNRKTQLETAIFDELNQEGKIDYVLLSNELKSESEEAGLTRKRMVELKEIISFRTLIQDLEVARSKMEPMDSQAAAGKIAEVSSLVKKLRERVELGAKKEDKKDATTNKVSTADAGEKSEPVLPIKLTPVLAKRAAHALSQIRETMNRWFEFYDGYQPDFSWWVRKPHEEAKTALEGFEKYLREEVAGIKGKDEDPLIGDPVGTEALKENIATQFIPYSPEELVAIGEKEFAWCESEMKKASAEMGFGDDWKKALAKVKADFAPPGHQDDFVRDAAREAIDFVKQNNLVTVPPLCEETWRLTMLSPDAQKSLPYVAYGGQKMLVAYAKEEMKHDDKLMAMRGNNRHFTRITTAHELIPGHHLQMFVAARNRSYRSLFSTPFVVEGWALYWETRLWDLGYAKTPEDRIGMLFWRMHRCARIIVSLKFHLGEMKPKEMVDFLMERVGHEKLGATSEVRRFIGGDYSPLYQIAYMIGGMQLRALHNELVVAGKMSEKEFNDTVLTYNAIPVELIRAGMLNLPLKRDTKSTWRFAD